MSDIRNSPPTAPIVDPFRREKKELADFVGLFLSVDENPPEEEPDIMLPATSFDPKFVSIAQKLLALNEDNALGGTASYLRSVARIKSPQFNTEAYRENIWKDDLLDTLTSLEFFSNEVASPSYKSEAAKNAIIEKWTGLMKVLCTTFNRCVNPLEPEAQANIHQQHQQYFIGLSSLNREIQNILTIEILSHTSTLDVKSLAPKSELEK